MWSVACSLGGVAIGFLLLPVVAFSSHNPLIVLAFTMITGFVAGSILAGRHLAVRQVPNAALIAIVAAICSFCVIPIIGTLIFYPILTNLLGKQR